ncbi:hypothetical protein TNCV_1157211 [Trichonephila clavipes]|nr:hypothetical protein TNCV_1157211 [Trichonephila clavipes]
MRKAVWAVYFHIRSSDEETLHRFCPVGPNSWCKYKNQVLEGSVETFRHSNKLPVAVIKHDFSASKATNHDVVGDEIENNNANPQTLLVENKHINPPEEPEHMANADYDDLKKPSSVFFFFYFKPLPKAKPCEKKRKKQKSELKHCYKHTHQRMLAQREQQKKEMETLKKTEKRSP